MSLCPSDFHQFPLIFHHFDTHSGELIWFEVDKHESISIDVLTHRVDYVDVDVVDDDEADISEVPICSIP